MDFVVIETTGDLWTFPADYRAIPTNGELDGAGCLVMGAGVALRAKQRWPSLPGKLGRWVEKYGNRPFVLVTEGLITFPTKGSWRDKSSVKRVLESARLATGLADKYGMASVVMPRVGAGLGGLDWDDLGPRLHEVLDDRFIVVSREV